MRPWQDPLQWEKSAGRLTTDDTDRKTLLGASKVSEAVGQRPGRACYRVAQF